MLSWIFKKKTPTPTPTPTPRTAAGAGPAKPNDEAVKQAARQAAQAEAAAWDVRLKAALGDDAALLLVAREAPAVDTKLAAVMALAGEDALKEAEREFRTHDRRVHRAAKQRHAALVAQREARRRAAALIASAEALGTQAVIPANRLVALDRDWQAIDLALVDDAQKTSFAELSQRLTALMRERGEHEARTTRWLADAELASTTLQGLCVAVAEGSAERAALAAAVAAAQALQGQAPAGDATAPKLAALQAAVQLAEQLDSRLSWLDELQQAPVPVPASVAAEPALVSLPVQVPQEAVASTAVNAPVDESTAAAEPGGTTSSETPAAQAAAASNAEADPAQATIETAQVEAAAAEDAAPATRGEPAAANEPAPIAGDVETAAAPLPTAPAVEVIAPAPSPVARWRSLPPVLDARVSAALNQRFDEWQRARAEPQRQRQAEKRAQADEKRARKEQQASAQQQQSSQALEALLTQAEAALAEGHLADTQKHLAVIDNAGGPEAAPAALRGRIYALQAEFARLKGWQQWGGGRARDDLVVEAEALAALTAQASEPNAKLPIKPHADAIDDMRKRWKELDRLGGATSQALWQRFDAALKLAYEPVAVHLAALEAARQANLEARRALLDTLDAVALPGAQDASADGSEAPVAVHWKDLARALDAFQVEWRKLGPAEHTVPHKARDKLLERMRAAVSRIEAPLQDARRVAQRTREALVQRAKALGDESNAASRDAVTRVRELQAEWQQEARTLPLARAVENALWAEFKAATDAVFAQREASFNARDAVFKANHAAREALILQLEALHADTPASDIKRALGDIDAQWRNAGEVLRNDVAGLESRFRQARDSAQRHLNDSAHRKWQVACDALIAKVALCEALERQGAGTDVADADARWASEPALPPVWEKVLAPRWQRAHAALASDAAAVVPIDPAALNALLLQLETALGVPSPAEFEAERRDLKLRVMKAALEGRQAPVAGEQSVEPLLAQALAHRVGEDGQRQRLQQILNAFRASNPLARY